VTKPLSVVIADDEAPARNELNFLLSELDSIKIVGEAADGSEALKIINEESPAAAFVDIKMPGKSGLQVAREISNLNISPRLVFITAYEKYALEAFQVDAVDYILKPFSRSQLTNVISRLKKLCQPEQDNFEVGKLPVYGAKNEIELIDYDQIIVFYTCNKKVVAKTKDQEYRVKTSLKDLEVRLPNDQFFRVHRSFLVNLRQVEKIIPWFKGKYQLVMADNEGKKVPVSRNKVATVKDIFGL
jgi:DNA-binding LytR/AlgR family response regulator